MVTHVGVASGPADQPDRDIRTGVHRSDGPGPVYVNVVVGGRRISPAWIDHTDPPPRNTPLVLVAGDDDVLRVRRLDTTSTPDHTHPDPWGDRIRVGDGDPLSDDDAPVGAVHVNAATGRLYRKVTRA